MGRRGPPPTPTKLLKARGSWRAKTRPNEPAPPPAIPDAPDWLSAEARAEWERQVLQLTPLGLLAKADRALLAAYCEAWAEFVEAVEFVAEHGHTSTTELGNVIQHPMVGIKNRAAERLNRFAQQFGFSPSSRTHLHAPEPKTKGQHAKGRFFKAK